MTQDETRDIAIAIVDELVRLKFVPDCIDTDNQSEFEAQDMIVKILKKRLIINKGKS